MEVSLLMKKYICIILIATIAWGCSKEGPTPLIQLVAPTNGAVLDNNCANSDDMSEWFFDWEDFPHYAKYHLYVIGPNAIYPVINERNILKSEYKFILRGYISGHHTYNWTWKVRAYVVDSNGWTLWSETRYFDVLPQEEVCD